MIFLEDYRGTEEVQVVGYNEVVGVATDEDW